MLKTRKVLVEDFFASIPVILGNSAVTIPFGIIAAKMGLPIWAILCMSYSVYAASAMFAALNLILISAPVWIIFLTTLLINFRHVLMSMSLGNALKPQNLTRLLVIGFGNSDETYAINMARKPSSDYLDANSVARVNIISYFGFTLSATLGAYLGQVISFDISLFKGAIPIMFTSLIITQLKKKRDLLIAFFAIFLTSVLSFTPLNAYSYLIAILIVPTCMTIFEISQKATLEKK